MSLREDLEIALLNAMQVSALSEKYGPAGFDEKMGETACKFLRDHGQELLEAVADSERMNELELSQRADVYWHENGEQELAGYEWGCAGQYSSARDALDAVIDFNRNAASTSEGEK